MLFRRSGATQGLFVRAATALAGAALLLAWMSAAASAANYSPSEAMHTLNTTLETHSKLEGFSGYSAGTKQQLEKALGIDEFRNAEYREGSSGELLSHYGFELPEAEATIVTTYAKTLTESARATPTEGATAVTTERVGGEAANAEVGLIQNKPIVGDLPEVLLGLGDYLIWKHNVSEIEKDLTEPVEHEIPGLAVEKEA